MIRIENIASTRNGRLKNFGLSVRDVIETEVQKKGGYTNAHAHLDRFATVCPHDLIFSRRVDIPLQTKWTAIDEMKRKSTVGDIYDRISRGVEYQLAQGVTAIGTFIDIDPVIGDKAIKAAQKVRDNYPEIDIVFINQVLKGVLEPEAKYWFDEAVQFVDIIGGLPAKDKGKEAAHLDVLLATAKSTGKRVHVHVDQNDLREEKETELLINKTTEHGMEGRVVAVHAISVAAQDRPYREALYSRMKAEGVFVVACPTAWIDRQRREDLAPVHNSVTPVDEMIPAGVTVGLGTDNIEDLYCPLNEGSMWDELKLMANSTRYRDMNQLVNVATVNGRRILGLPYER